MGGELITIRAMGTLGEPDVAARPIVDRALRDEADWWRVRDLLVETFAATPRGWNWDVRHWDGQRFHSEVPATVAEMAREVRLWESDRGVLLGVVHREGPGEVVLELRPDARESRTTTSSGGSSWKRAAIRCRAPVPSAGRSTPSTST
jgi:hypothetical protein